MQDSYRDHVVDTNQQRNRFMGQPIISDQIDAAGLATVCRNLQAVLDKEVPGDIVEFGCYVGTASLFIRRTLDAAGESATRAFHVYDSFEGLPEKDKQDASAAGVQFTAGKLYVSKKEFIQQFQRARLALPIIHKGWFDQLPESTVPDHIAFAFLDGDFYGSILSSLRLVVPRLSRGGRILIDDYHHDKLPGVEKAVRDYFQTTHPRITTEQDIAIITL